jgi:hypothetical protein
LKEFSNHSFSLAILFKSQQTVQQISFQTGPVHLMPEEKIDLIIFVLPVSEE